MSIGQEIIEYIGRGTVIQKITDADGNKISPYVLVCYANAEEQLTAFVTERTGKDAPTATEALHITSSDYGPWVTIVWQEVRSIEVMHSTVWGAHDCHLSVEAMEGIKLLGDPVQTIEEGLASGLAYARAQAWMDYRITIVGKE